MEAANESPSGLSLRESLALFCSAVAIASVIAAVPKSNLRRPAVSPRLRPSSERLTDRVDVPCIVAVGKRRCEVILCGSLVVA